MNILSMNYYNYFVTKKSLNNISYRKFLLNSKQNKKRTCLNKKGSAISSCYKKDMVETCYIKGVQKQNRCF